MTVCWSLDKKSENIKSVKLMRGKKQGNEEKSQANWHLLAEDVRIKLMSFLMQS